MRSRRQAEALETTSQAGGIFLLRRDMISAEDHDVLRFAARVVLLSRHGTLSEQIVRLLRGEPAAGPPRPERPSAPTGDTSAPHLELEFFNGLGGFGEDGREYVTILGEGQWTPAPWINVIANPSFGFFVSESGSGCTWAVNSQQNQLTPWSNDPVSDPPGEAILIRDEETGEIWGPTALPARDAWPYVARHGQGYSRFEHESRGIRLDLTQFVPLEDPVKISCLSIENRSRAPRQLSVTAYAEWVLGSQRGVSAPFLITQRDAETGALFALNPWNEQFAGRVAFADLSPSRDRVDRRPRRVPRPQRHPRRPGRARARGELSRKAGAGLDPCAALQTALRLAPGEKVERGLPARPGRERGRRAASHRALPERGPRRLPRLRAANVGRHARRRAGRDARPVHGHPVEPLASLPDPLLPDLGAHRLLPGSRRLRLPRPAPGRDGPDRRAARIAREHLLRAAARQFEEGDVQHWWHPPSGRACAPGCPTTCSGSPTPSRTTSRSPATRACSTSRCRSCAASP